MYLGIGATSGGFGGLLGGLLKSLTAVDGADDDDEGEGDDGEERD